MRGWRLDRGAVDLVLVADFHLVSDGYVGLSALLGVRLVLRRALTVPKLRCGRGAGTRAYESTPGREQDYDIRLR